MTNGFAFNHDKSLQIYFFCVKHQSKNDFLKDVESILLYGLHQVKKCLQTSANCPDSDHLVHA